MWQLSFFVFLFAAGIFAGVMIHDPRTLWSGVSFFWMMLCLAVFSLFTLAEGAPWLASHSLVIGLLMILFFLAALSLLALPLILIVLFFIEGIKVIRHEGMKPSNLLSLSFSILLYAYLAIWPAFGKLGRNTWGTALYAAISFSVLYILSLMAMYSLSAVLNLIHLKKRQHADYILVLGCGVLGDKVTPLLAARIDRGIALLRYNPDAALILSGGQGPGEDVAESTAMAIYAADKGVAPEKIILEQNSVSTWENLQFSRELMHGAKPRILVVTTAYHVFRALLLARQQGIRCKGFGAKTKWYFTLNALLREFAGYLRLTWRRHVIVIGAVACLMAILAVLS